MSFWFNRARVEKPREELRQEGHGPQLQVFQDDGLTSRMAKGAQTPVQQPQPQLLPQPQQQQQPQRQQEQQQRKNLLHWDDSHSTPEQPLVRKRQQHAVPLDVQEGDKGTDQRLHTEASILQVGRTEVTPSHLHLYRQPHQQESTNQPEGTEQQQQQQQRQQKQQQQRRQQQQQQQQQQGHEEQQRQEHQQQQEQQREGVAEGHHQAQNQSGAGEEERRETMEVDVDTVTVAVVAGEGKEDLDSRAAKQEQAGRAEVYLEGHVEEQERGESDWDQMGPRAQQLRDGFGHAIAIMYSSAESLLSAIGDVGTQEGVDKADLINAADQMVSAWRQYCEEEFEDILKESQVEPALNMLDRLHSRLLVAQAHSAGAIAGSSSSTSGGVRSKRDAVLDRQLMLLMQRATQQDHPPATPAGFNTAAAGVEAGRRDGSGTGGDAAHAHSHVRGGVGSEAELATAAAAACVLDTVPEEMSRIGLVARELEAREAELRASLAQGAGEASSLLSRVDALIRQHVESDAQQFTQRFETSLSTPPPAHHFNGGKGHG